MYVCIYINMYHLYVDNVQNHIDGTCITVHILKFDQPFKPSFWDNSYPNELTYYRSWITAQTLGPFIQWPWKISLQWFLTKQKGLEYALETWHGTQQRRSPRGFSRRPIDFAKFGMCFQRCHFAFENSLGFWAQLSNIIQPSFRSDDFEPWDLQLPGSKNFSVRSMFCDSHLQRF